MELKRSQIEFLARETKHLSAFDFTRTCNYYGISVVRHSILCVMRDHTDTHYGSCMVAKDGKSAYCFVCHKSIDPVQIVMEKEGLRYPQAMQYLWRNVLGNVIPDAEEDQNGPPLTYEEMEFIGLSGCFGGEITLPYGLCISTQETENKRYDIPSKEGCVLAKASSFPSMFKLYETDPKLAWYLMMSKTRETISYYEKLKRNICDPQSDLSRLVHGEEKKRNYIDMINEKLKTATSILKKLGSAS